MRRLSGGGRRGSWRSFACACLLLPAAPVAQDLVLKAANAEVQARAGRIVAPTDPPPAGTRKLELPRGFVVPGLHDAHAHLIGLGQALASVDLVGTTSFAEVIARVRARAAQTPKGEWVVGRGWDQNDWQQAGMPQHAPLSEAVPDHPVWLTRIDGHAALANALALRLAGLTKASRSPEGGEILRDAEGEPTGVFVDRAMALVGAAVPDPTAAQTERHLLAAQDACLAAGLTCVHEAGITDADLGLLRRLHAQGRWRLRVYAMLAQSEIAAIERGPWQTPDHVLIVRAVKGYADGALGSRGAALLTEYSDRPGHRGLLVTPKAQLQKLAQLCADRGFQFCVHAIGDRANREVLDVIAATRFPHGSAAARFRIEHAQVVHPDDFARFAALGVLPAMQPTHLTSDMPWAPQRLGGERVAGAYAWRTFHGLGVVVPFGSDFPVESHDPRKGLYAAVTTRPEAGGDELRPEQRLSPEAALDGFTRHAAYGAFLEREVGTLAPGMLLDATVFDRDLTTCPPAELLQAKVLLTVIGGRVVYEAPPK